MRTIHEVAVYMQEGDKEKGALAPRSCGGVATIKGSGSAPASSSARTAGAKSASTMANRVTKLGRPIALPIGVSQDLHPVGELREFAWRGVGVLFGLEYRHGDPTLRMNIAIVGARAGCHQDQLI